MCHLWVLQSACIIFIINAKKNHLVSKLLFLFFHLGCFVGGNCALVQTLLLPLGEHSSTGCLSANSQLSSGCQLDHTLGVMAGLGVLAGTLTCFRNNQLSIFSSDPTVIWDARWICGCDVPSPPFEMSAVGFGSLPLMSQLAAMAHLQVITKPGIRLHKNLHVCNCVSLPQKKPQAETVSTTRTSVTVHWELSVSGRQTTSHTWLYILLCSKKSRVWSIPKKCTPGCGSSAGALCSKFLVPVFLFSKGVPCWVNKLRG